MQVARVFAIVWHGCKHFENFLFVGYYMYIEASFPRQLGDDAVLSSPAFPFRGLTCVTFYYHMYGAAMGNLTMTVNGRTLFSKSGNQGNAWLKAQVNTFAFGLHKVGGKKFRGVAVSRCGIWLYLLELATILNWRWRVGLLCPIFFSAKGQRKAVNYYFLDFDEEPQSHKMPFTEYYLIFID